MRADYIDRIGTGIARMRETIAELGKGSVQFTFTAFFTTSFSRPSFADGSVKTTTKTTTNQLDIIVALIRKTPTITAKEISAILNITEEGVRYHLKKLKKINKIKHIGPAKGGHWEIIGKDEGN